MFLAHSIFVRVLFFAILLACGTASAFDATSVAPGGLSESEEGEIEESLRRIGSDLPEELEACSLSADSAKQDGEISLAVRLRCNGFETLEVMRTVSPASAAAQARAMARELVETAVERAAIWEASVGASSEEEVFKASAPPVPTGPYSRRKALGLSFGMTFLPMILGVPMMVVGFYLDGSPTLITSGSVLTAAGASFGPSMGYFYLHRYAHGWGLGVGRFFMLAGAVGFSFLGFLEGLRDDEWEHNNCEDLESEEAQDSCHYEGSNAKEFLFLGVFSATATLVAAIVDAAFVGRAADAKNASVRAHIMMLPAPVLTGEGRLAPGLSVSGRF